MNREANPNSCLQLGEQLEHPGLHRDVERRGRLVRDQQLRVERERPGEAGPLALAAAELVREAVAVRPRQLHRLEQLVDTPPAPSAPDRRSAVHDQRLGHALARSSAAG